jgi:TRAP-type uncharacterized transport system substrate-binding protein
MLKRNSVLTFVIGILVVLLATTSTFAAVKFISIATGSTGGTYYPVGVILATTFGEELKDSGYRFSAHASLLRI